MRGSLSFGSGEDGREARGSDSWWMRSSGWVHDWAQDKVESQRVNLGRRANGEDYLSCILGEGRGQRLSLVALCSDLVRRRLEGGRCIGDWGEDGVAGSAGTWCCPCVEPFENQVSAGREADGRLGGPDR